MIFFAPRLVFKMVNSSDYNQLVISPETWGVFEQLDLPLLTAGTNQTEHELLLIIMNNSEPLTERGREEKRREKRERSKEKKKEIEKRNKNKKEQ